MLGVFNHLWESIGVISDEHKISLHEFAKRNHTGVTHLKVMSGKETSISHLNHTFPFWLWLSKHLSSFTFPAWSTAALAIKRLPPMPAYN